MLHELLERRREIQLRRNDEELPDSGFTLIELLIVIVVLGILAAIVIFSLSGVTGSSAASACNSDAKTVETAVAAYNAQNPENQLPDLDNTGTAPDTTTPLVPSYLHTWPGGSTNAKYTISYDTTAGVEVSVNGGAAKSYDGSPNPCSALS